MGGGHCAGCGRGPRAGWPLRTTVCATPIPPAAPSGDECRHQRGAADGTGVAAQRAWAQQYGHNRATMPDLPDVASASPEQQAAATDLLTRTQAGTAGYASTDAAQAAGYDFAAALARAKNNPRMARRLAQHDRRRHRPTQAVVLRVVNKTYLHDGHVLDPTAPEALIYTYQGHNSWKTLGATFSAEESYPNPPPDPGGQSPAGDTAPATGMA